VKRAVVAIAVFVAATVTAYIAVLFGYGWYADTFLVHDFEGATAMGVAFAIAPAVAVAVGLAAAIWAWVRVARRTAKP
jgi:hypothetical protein